ETKLLDAVEIDNDVAGGVARDDSLDIIAGGKGCRAWGTDVVKVERAVESIEAEIAGRILQIKDATPARNAVEAEQQYDRVDVRRDDAVSGSEDDAAALREMVDRAREAIDYVSSENIAGRDVGEVGRVADGAVQVVLELIIGSGAVGDAKDSGDVAVAVHCNGQRNSSAGSVAAPIEETVTGVGNRCELHILAEVGPDLRLNVRCQSAGRVAVDRAVLCSDP